MLIKLIEKFFYNLIIRQRLWIIKKCENKIVKYRSKHNFYIKYLEEIKRDTKELLDKGTYL